MKRIKDFAKEADNATALLSSKGYPYRGDNYIRRYKSLAYTSNICSETKPDTQYDYKGGYPAGPTVSVGPILIKERKEEKKMGSESCDELRRRAERGEEVGPNYCGLASFKTDDSIYDSKGNKNTQTVPTKPSWGNGCVENNAQNTGGAKAVWTQCALSLCIRTRLICEDSQGALWVSRHLNGSDHANDDDNWEYVVRVNSGQPNSIGMYPEGGNVRCNRHKWRE